MTLPPVWRSLDFRYLSIVWHHPPPQMIWQIIYLVRPVTLLVWETRQSGESRIPHLRMVTSLLLGLDEEDVHPYLSELHSILSIPPPNSSSTNKLEIWPTHASYKISLSTNCDLEDINFDGEAFCTDLAQKYMCQSAHCPWIKIFRSGKVFNEFHISLYSSFNGRAWSQNNLLQVCDVWPWFKLRPPCSVSGLPVFIPMAV